eukprot:6914263-Prymnesium_polylepis.1
MAKKGDCKCPRCCGSKCGMWGDHGWARSAFDWLNRTWPHPEHRLINLGEPGGSLIPSIGTCPQTYLGDFEPDVILFDLATTEVKYGERLLRNMINVRPRPVALLIEFFPFIVEEAIG